MHATPFETFVLNADKERNEERRCAAVRGRWAEFSSFAPKFARALELARAADYAALATAEVW